jgi:hypothetical protein
MCWLVTASLAPSNSIAHMNFQEWADSHGSPASPVTTLSGRYVVTTSANITCRGSFLKCPPRTTRQPAHAPPNVPSGPVLEDVMPLFHSSSSDSLSPMTIAEAFAVFVARPRMPLPHGKLALPDRVPNSVSRHPSPAPQVSG